MNINFNHYKFMCTWSGINYKLIPKSIFFQLQEIFKYNNLFKVDPFTDYITYSSNVIYIIHQLVMEFYENKKN